MEYYILVRDGKYQITTSVYGSDPLFGYGSWNLYSGPYDSYDDASLILKIENKVDGSRF